MDVSENEGLNPGDSIQVRLGNDQSSSLVSMQSVNSSQVVTIDSSNFEQGDYYLRADGSPELDATNTNFEIVRQEMIINPDRELVENVGDNTNVEFVIDTNRGEFDIEVTASELGTDDLTHIFDDAIVENNQVILKNIRHDEITANFEDIEFGEYTIEFAATDTDAQAQVEITVLGDIIQPTDPAEYRLGIETDGSTYAIGFPGPIDETYADIFDDSMDGIDAVYRYHSDSSQWEHLHGSQFDESPNALDAIVVLTDGTSDATVHTLEITFSSQNPSVPSAKYLDEGWEFISASTYDDVNTVLERGSADATVVLDQFTEPSVDQVSQVNRFQFHQTTPHYDFGGADPPLMNPFKGYFVFVTNEGSIPSLVSDVESRQEADSALNTAAVA